MASTKKIPSLTPYVFFDGRCEEAIKFYQRALGAKVLMLARFKDSPDPAAIPPGGGKKVMHARLKIGANSVMVSDGRAGGKPRFEGFALTLSVNSTAQAKKFFTALSKGGKMEMPLAKTFFSPSFGMLIDRFGVMWMVITEV